MHPARRALCKLAEGLRSLLRCFWQEFREVIWGAGVFALLVAALPLCVLLIALLEPDVFIVLVFIAVVVVGLIADVLEVVL